ncbi:WhiB family transcriptional regulator [Pseudonocardia pini]|uniref:WhiB family transcriptional regulator n=1 Tax=Pseudonocardia pini TaxID=2758030 RepID=UPI0015F1187C|nr:WhiB family transcriptional regulator [Pseudonocardia pini]
MTTTSRQRGDRVLDNSLFFHPERERGLERQARELQAKQVCRGCPVIEQCRRWALAAREPYGVWGGLSVADRAVILEGGRRNGVVS